MKAGRRLKGGNMKITHVNPESMLKVTVQGLIAAPRLV
jgi:hypothetical protein